MLTKEELPECPVATTVPDRKQMENTDYTESVRASLAFQRIKEGFSRYQPEGLD